MVRLYERLSELNVTMIIEPDMIHEGNLYFSFKKDDNQSKMYPIHIDSIKLVPEKTGCILTNFLNMFLFSLK